ncbi:TPA: hypothetical protein SAN82_005115 [Pseudomonas putida]|nr:hypothetical protein [Pseudomonas putida]
MNAVSAIVPFVFALGISTASAATFDGNTCLGDCSGHQAGYNWAEQNDIDDESYCNTPSVSFNQGCESYVEDNAGAVSDDEEEDEDDDE